MTDFAQISVRRNPPRKAAGTVVILAGDALELGRAARALGVEALVRRAAATAEFKGKARTTLDIARAGRAATSTGCVVVGMGKADDDRRERLGAARWRGHGRARQSEGGDGLLSSGRTARSSQRTAAANFALGMKLRAYAFDNYKTTDEGENGKRAPA